MKNKIIAVLTLVMLMVSAISVQAAVDDSYTVSLLHFDGTDGSTSITDESGKTWSSSAQIDDAQSKFGGTSELFNSTTSITSPGNTDFVFGTDDFTIDFWLRTDNFNGNKTKPDKETAQFHSSKNSYEIQNFRPCKIKRNII